MIVWSLFILPIAKSITITSEAKVAFFLLKLVFCGTFDTIFTFIQPPKRHTVDSPLLIDLSHVKNLKEHGSFILGYKFNFVCFFMFSLSEELGLFLQKYSIFFGNFLSNLLFSNY